MSLPNDICRCLGNDGRGLCKERETCERYLQANNCGCMTPFSLRLCRDGIYVNKIEAHGKESE